MPIHNAERFLLDALESLSAQAFIDWQLIAVDDGCTDRSLEILHGWAGRQQKDVVLLSTGTRSGSAIARNLAIETAQADLLAFLDADDVWLPDRLQQAQDHLAVRPQVGVSYGPSVKMIHADGRPLARKSLRRKFNLPELFWDSPWGFSNLCIRRKTMLEAKGNFGFLHPDLINGQDVELLWRVAYKTDWLLESSKRGFLTYRVYDSEGSRFESQVHGKKRSLEIGREYMPELVARWQRVSTAAVYRYLSRRCVAMGKFNEAKNLIHKSLEQTPEILWCGGTRTLETLLAAYILSFCKCGTHSKDTGH